MPELGTSSREAKRGHWEWIIKEQEESGRSGAAFCRERQISYQTFAYWKKRLSKDRPAARSKASFQELVVSPDALQPDGFELILGSVRIRVPARFDESALRRLLSVVSGSC